MTDIEKQLREAIAGHNLIRFGYGDGKRTIEPYILGYDHDNKLRLCGWQWAASVGVAYDSKFADFLAENISNLETLEQTFVRPKDAYQEHCFPAFQQVLLDVLTTPTLENSPASNPPK